MPKPTVMQLVSSAATEGQERRRDSQKSVHVHRVGRSETDRSLETVRCEVLCELSFR